MTARTGSLARNVLNPIISDLQVSPKILMNYSFQNFLNCALSNFA